MTTDFAIWMETGTGQRTLLALSPCQTLALLIGEAVWAHISKNRTTPLDVSIIEVRRCSSSCQSGAPANMPQIIARWSASGREKLHVSNASPSVSAAGTPYTPSLTASCRGSHLSGLEHQEARSSGLAAFFPTKEEWEAWGRREP